MNYRRLEKGEIIQEGDEIDRCVDPWRDEPIWEPAGNIGEPAPDPQYVSHRQYRRPITTGDAGEGERMTEQLKFKEEKHYRTRDERKATVLLIRPDYMVGEIEGTGGPLIWQPSGNFYRKAQGCGFDLVAEWREPARVTVAVFQDKHSGELSIANVTNWPAGSLSQAGLTLLARREIVEGEGMG